MDLLPDFDYTDHNVIVYGEDGKPTSTEQEKKWWFPLVWLSMLVIVILAWAK